MEGKPNTMTEAATVAGLVYERRDDVVILTLVETAGGLSAETLAELTRHLTLAERDAEIAGVVLVLQGGHGIGPKLAEDLNRASARVEMLGKPVIAVLVGTVCGTLWALALASHFRFAAAEAKVVMHEARFGFLPGGGITQRLPRLIGAAESIRLILSTRPEPANELMALGALDQVHPIAPVSEAVEAIRAGLAPRPTLRQSRGMRDRATYLNEVQAFRERVSEDPLDVSRAVVQVVESALLLPFAQGLALETVTLEDLAQAPESRAIAHANQVDRVVRDRMRALAAQLKGSGAPGVERLGLWCPGPERAELVVAALTRGLSVVIADPDPDGEARPSLLNRVASLQESLVAQDALAPETGDADRARLSWVITAEDLHDCDLILLAQPDYPRFNSDLSLIALGHDPSDPDPLPALLPAPYAKGHAEISLPPTYSRRSVAQVLALSAKLGWRLLQSGPGGFIAYRLRKVLRGLPMRMKEAGFTSAEISQGMAAAGLGAVQVGKRVEPSGGAYEVGYLALAALANESARLLGDGTGLSAAEVDAAALSSGVMPRWRGGPLYQADLRGLILLRADLQRLAGDEPADVAPMIEQLIHEGGHFFPPAR